MCVEIEVKLKVDSLPEVSQRLTEVGAEFLREQFQKDYYFDDADMSLLKTDRCLRLRRQDDSASREILLTYKGAVQKDKFKKRREVELEVADGDSLEKLLSAIGYNRALVIEKKRRLWRLGECFVALDKVHLLGNFVEIEGPDDQKIDDVRKRLGLQDLPQIKKGYAFLMREQTQSTH